MAGELSRGKNTLQRIREEIIIASQELGRITAEKSRLDSECSFLRSEKERLAQMNNNEESRHSSLCIKNAELESLCARSTSRLDKDSRGMEEISLSVENYKQKILSLIAQAAQLEELILSSKGSISGYESLKNKTTLEIQSLLTEKVGLQNEMNSILKKIEGAQAIHDTIVESTEDILIGFRLYEKRIAMFSRQTGYVLGYESPERLLDKK